MRGYFAIGAERISKPLNMGNLLRSAHAFGAKFFFTVGAHPRAFEAYSDTSKAVLHLPVYNWNAPADIALPKKCKLVGVELLDDAVDLPAFRHPLHAAYILGPERGVLSDEVLARCDHVVKIPTAFCINVAMAGAIIMYDRIRSLGHFPPRIAAAHQPSDLRPAHVFGKPKSRTACQSCHPSGPGAFGHKVRSPEM